MSTSGGQVLQVIGMVVSIAGYPVIGTIITAAGSAMIAAAPGEIPKVNDLKVPQLQYGSKLMRLYGSNRTSGALGWYSEKRIIPGDGGGKGEPDAPTADTADMDVLYILSVDSNITAIARVFKNSELVWSQHTDSDDDSIAASAETTAWEEIFFLDGNPAQLPHPVIEAIDGVGNATAYRHRQCVLIQGLHLGQSGQLPLMEFEAIKSGGSRVSAGGAEMFSLWRVVQHDWGPINNTDYVYGLPDDTPEIGAMAAASAAQFSYESVWGPNSRGPYLLKLPAGDVSPLGEPIAYQIEATTGGITCTVLRLFLGTDPGIEVWEPDTEDLAVIVSTEWARVGDVADIDATELEGIPVRGFQSSGSVRGAYEALAAVFHFGMVVSDKAYFRLKGAPAVATIAYGQLAAGEDKAADEPFAPVRANDEEVLERAMLTYPNYSDDYANGTETGNRGIGTSTIVAALQTNVVMIPSEAKAVAETLAAMAGIAATIGQITLTDYYAAFEPTDAIIVPDGDGNLHRMRMQRLTSGRGVRALDLVRDDVTALIAPGVTSGGYTQSLTITLPAETEIVLLDIPMLRDVDNDPGIYAVAKGAVRGSTLYSSLDGVTYAPEVAFTQQSVFGPCTTILGNWAGGRVFDEVNSVTVNVGVGNTLSGATRAALLADQAVNACAIGIDGRWELCQFRTPELLSAGYYTLTGFLRGSRGTEWASTGHGGGETFVLLTGAGRRVEIQVGELGVMQYFKGVSAGRMRSSASYQMLSADGVGLKPFAPVGLRKIISDSAVTVEWNRRTRMSTRLASPLGISSPLGEVTESYDVELRDAGDALVSTTTVTAPQWSAASAEVTGNLTGTASDLSLIGGELVGLVDGRVPGYQYRFIRHATSGAVVASGSVLGHAVYQWTNDGDELYAATADFTATTPQYYVNSKIQRVTRTAIGTVAATYTAPAAGDLQGVAFDGTHIWVTESDSANLRKLDKTTLASVAVYALETGLKRVYHRSGSLWICKYATVTDPTNAIIEWDIATTSEVGRIVLASSPGRLLFVGGFLFVRLDDEVRTYDATSLALVATVPAPNYGDGLFEFGSYVAASRSYGVVLIDSSTGFESRAFSTQVTYLGSSYTLLFNLAGANGSALYATIGGSGLGAQTVGFELTAPGLTGYSVTIYQNSAVVGRGYPATLSL